MSDIINKKRTLSGIQPTNTPHLGNYLGAMKNWVEMQNNEELEALFFIADLHSLTVRPEPAFLRKQTLESYALLLAAGIDPKKTIAFVQSHVPAHSELTWLLSCYTQFGELSRMTQFKDKSEKQPENINAGLFTYPVLMAADILAYQSDYVPVGADQKQHLEIARNIAQRFNSVYGEVLTVPEPYITKQTEKIMSLADPLSKMSKSDENKNATVFVLDERDVIIKKFKRAVTDSETAVRYRESDGSKAGVNSLMSIYSAATGKTLSETEKEFEGKGYGDFKAAVGESVADLLLPIQDNYKKLSADKEYLTACMRDGAERASALARKTLRKVQKKIGILQL